MIINYTDVHLRHESRTILSGVNLQAQPGDMIYLTGLVGSGKSTLLSSMYGDTPIYNGRAMILGHDMRRIKSSKLQFLRRQIGIVHQELRLLPDRTIYENLDFVLRATDWNKKDLRKERIEEVLKWVDLSDTAKRYPHELSGGQKQRLSIARVFLKDPPILILDEATSALDNTTEILIQKSLQELCVGRTTLVVAHRLSTVKNANRIAVIDGGLVAESGTHNELIGKGGIYKDLYSLQFRE